MEKEPTPRYTIRAARPEDMERCRRMQAASWRATYPSAEFDISQEWVDDFTDGWFTPERLEGSTAIFGAVIHDDAQFYRLAERDGDVVGFVHCALRPDQTKELEAIYTAPDTFGTGLGDQLMAVADEWLGDTTTMLTVASYNHRARRFYQKHGFEEIVDSDGLYANKIPTIRMIRKGAAS